jgi:hypothetical protein
MPAYIILVSQSENDTLVCIVFRIWVKGMKNRKRERGAPTTKECVQKKKNDGLALCITGDSFGFHFRLVLMEKPMKRRRQERAKDKRDARVRRTHRHPVCAMLTPFVHAALLRAPSSTVATRSLIAGKESLTSYQDNGVLGEGK